MNSENEVRGLIQGVELELTNLKTAHLRPLGALDFFKKVVSLSVTPTTTYGYYVADFWVDVVIETPDVTPPIVQSGWDTPSGMGLVDALPYAYNISSDYSTYSYNFIFYPETSSTITFNFSALSSLPIQSIGVRS